MKCVSAGSICPPQRAVCAAVPHQRSKRAWQRTRVATHVRAARRNRILYPHGSEEVLIIPDNFHHRVKEYGSTHSPGILLGLYKVV